MKDKNYIEENAKEIPPVSIGPPVDTSPGIQSSKPIISQCEQFWKDRSLEQLKNYKQGITFSSNIQPDDYITVLKNLIYMIETGVKTPNISSQNAIAVTAIFKSLISSIEVLKSLDLDVDKNEIIAISKIDLLNKNYDELIKLTSEKTGKKPILFSCFSGYGISELKKNLF